jgi:hypothetical protein
MQGIAVPPTARGPGYAIATIPVHRAADDGCRDQLSSTPRTLNFAGSEWGHKRLAPRGNARILVRPSDEEFSRAGYPAGPSFRRGLRFAFFAFVPILTGPSPVGNSLSEWKWGSRTDGEAQRSGATVICSGCTAYRPSGRRSHIGDNSRRIPTSRGSLPDIVPSRSEHSHPGLLSPRASAY